jgi:hypothetical protein
VDVDDSLQKQISTRLEGVEGPVRRLRLGSEIERWLGAHMLEVALIAVCIIAVVAYACGRGG